MRFYCLTVITILAMVNSACTVNTTASMRSHPRMTEMLAETKTIAVLPVFSVVGLHGMGDSEKEFLVTLEEIKQELKVDVEGRIKDGGYQIVDIDLEQVDGDGEPISVLIENMQQEFYRKALISNHVDSISLLESVPTLTKNINADAVLLISLTGRTRSTSVAIAETALILVNVALAGGNVRMYWNTGHALSLVLVDSESTEVIWADRSGSRRFGGWRSSSVLSRIPSRFNTPEE